MRSADAGYLGWKTDKGKKQGTSLQGTVFKCVHRIRSKMILHRTTDSHPQGPGNSESNQLRSVCRESDWLGTNQRVPDLKFGPSKPFFFLEVNSCDRHGTLCPPNSSLRRPQRLRKSTGLQRETASTLLNARGHHPAAQIMKGTFQEWLRSGRGSGAVIKSSVSLSPREAHWRVCHADRSRKQRPEGRQRPAQRGRRGSSSEAHRLLCQQFAVQMSDATPLLGILSPW